MSADQGAATGASAPPAGLLHSLRNIGPTLLALLRTRLELFGIELAEERGRAAELAVQGALALLFAAMTLLMVNVLILALSWENHRYAAIVGLIAFYIVGAALFAMRIQRALQSRPPIFDATLAELKADMEALNRVRQD